MSKTVPVGREPVVRAALKLLDEVGLDGLTLRGVAAELGLTAPTLYWRFKNKQDLVDEMATQVLIDLRGGPGAEDVPESWPELTRSFARDLRAALLTRRDGARMVAGTRLRDPGVFKSMEAALRVFAAAGIPPLEAAVFLKTVNDFVLGFTIEQQAVVSASGARTPGYELDAREAAIDPELYPLSRRVGSVLLDNFDASFDRGVDYLVAGLRAETESGQPLSC
ncbi:MAG TPA: TetR/AcrR family transcriptional regulator C-terminal domain-containing protein [Caulobacteraceae bacterium]|nr:TetR/AcrR family transcriptional regulator C-terminal domain-containing protein [Caulobacteraceae bacterium]